LVAAGRGALDYRAAKASMSAKLKPLVSRATRAAMTLTAQAAAT
jgi:hypothetical protein